LLGVAADLGINGGLVAEVVGEGCIDLGEVEVDLDLQLIWSQDGGGGQWV
jgi:hypothetical protein